MYMWRGNLWLLVEIVFIFKTIDTEIEMCDVSSAFFDETNYTLYHSLKEHNIECCCFLHLGTDTMSLSIYMNTSDFVFIFPDGNQKRMIQDKIIANVQNSNIVCATGKYDSPLGQSGAINIVGNKVFRVKCLTYNWMIVPITTTSTVHLLSNGSKGITASTSMETNDAHGSTTTKYTSTHITTRTDKEYAKTVPFIIGGSVVGGVVIIIGVIIFVFVHRRRRRNEYRGRKPLNEAYGRQSHQMVTGDNCLYDHERGNNMYSLARIPTPMGSCNQVVENENHLVTVENYLYNYEEGDERIGDSQRQDQCQMSEGHYTMKVIL